MIVPPGWGVAYCAESGKLSAKTSQSCGGNIFLVLLKCHFPASIQNIQILSKPPPPPPDWFWDLCIFDTPHPRGNIMKRPIVFCCRHIRVYTTPGTLNHSAITVRVARYPCSLLILSSLCVVSIELACPSWREGGGGRTQIRRQQKNFGTRPLYSLSSQRETVTWVYKNCSLGPRSSQSLDVSPFIMDA